MAKEPRIYATSFRYTETVGKFLNKWPEGETIADRLESIVLTVKDTESEYNRNIKQLQEEIGQLEAKKHQLQTEVTNLGDFKTLMLNAFESLDKLQQTIGREWEEKLEDTQIVGEPTERAITGQEIMGTERFLPGVKHMIVIDVLSNESEVGFKGERLRLFLSEEGFKHAKEAEEAGQIRIKGHAAVAGGELYFDKPLKNSPLEKEIAARIKQGGFFPNRLTVNCIHALDSLQGKKHTVKEINEMFKKQKFSSMDEKNIVNKLSEEFKRQELTKGLYQEG